MGLRDRRRHRRPKERNDTGENPVRNGLSEVGAGICGFVGLDGGVCSRIRTGLDRPPPVIPCYSLLSAFFQGQGSLPFAGGGGTLPVFPRNLR
jgi:hypothetical protein